MRLVFTKGSGRFDHLDVYRDGERTARIDCPKQGIIPHDMVHYAVETTLQHRGFITHALEGVETGLRMDSTPASDGVERLVEVLQADGWSGWTGDPSDLRDLYLVTCEARRCAPLPLEDRDILAVRERIASLTIAWRDVAVGDSLTLTP